MIAVPALAVLLAFVVVIGRVGIAKGDLDAAAQYAARTISIARDPAAAVPAAQATARDTLQVGSPTCRSWTFDATVTSTEVTVEISCVADLSAAAVIPVPGSVRLESSFTELRDVFREDP